MRFKLKSENGSNTDSLFYCYIACLLRVPIVRTVFRQTDGVWKDKGFCKGSCSWKIGGNISRCAVCKSTNWETAI